MTLVVEDGTAKADAESYISVTDADTYFANRGYTLWATMSTNEKEQALRRSTDYMLQVYRLKWKGNRVNATQALDWPRGHVVLDDYGISYPGNEVPQEVRNACAELAFKAAGGDLAPDIGQRAVREKVDVIEVEYDRYAPQFTQFRAVDNMLAPFLTDLGGTVRRVVRS